MTVAVAILGVLVAGLALFVVALLRSHAEILRRLALLETALDSSAGVNAASLEASAGTDPALGRMPAGANAGGPATDIRGETLGGEPAAVQLRTGAQTRPTLLAFMGTGCNACVPLWQDLHSDTVPTPAGARLVVVTKGPERERIARLQELAPDDAHLVMSTRAWEDYAVPSTPHFVLVRDGRVAGRGAATSWEQITGFLEDAAADDHVHASRSLNTEARAARAERALTQAGITPDHPSLYPSRSESAGEQP